MAKIQIICSVCGGSNVHRDAYASWDVDDQNWVLGDIYDQGFCSDCDADRELIDKPIEGTP